MMLEDEQERSLALNPQKSFIVQAPAGSGKTELLTQRFLVLLATVQKPEEILAMTFTRKAAAEMRSRIMAALLSADSGLAGESVQTQKTCALAKKVLARNVQKEWHLLQNPERLRILTLDAMNSALTRQLPLLSGFGAAPEITPLPLSLYRMAVSEVMSHLEENLPWSDAIATLLGHLDIQPDKALTLLIKLLERRDQWLPLALKRSDQDRKMLEEGLARITEDILKKLSYQIPSGLSDELAQLANYAADNLGLAPFGALPGFNANDRDAWLRLCSLLLTDMNEWRKSFNKNAGFPKDNPDMKRRMSDVMQTLSDNTALKNVLCELRHSPKPCFSEKQWQMLEALLQVLHVLAAELRVVFQQNGQIDYTENALAALTALGNEQNPTDLTLALDCQIRHMLVDEFQDTSLTQFRLLEKLMLGWQENDGRTLFLVGDPMQSIYRFREAEVGLFIRARQKGIGNLPLQFLQLSANFRSTPHIVDWVNQHFPKVFPTFDDVATGAISYSKGIAKNQGDKASEPVKLFQVALQGEKIVSLITTYRALDPAGSIAILVRSRRHLADLLPSLKKAGIAYSATGIDPLSESPLIQDLMSLTRALLDPDDRISWLGILRAPWCGLSLSDLLGIASKNVDTPLWSALSNLPKGLSAEGMKRLERVLPVLASRLNQRERFTLRYQVESTWLLLGGPACLSSKSELKDAETFFNLLNQFDQKGLLPDAARLKESVATLFASPDPLLENPVQIMTLHNAKGLEFDTVILPHLEKKVTGDKKELLLWMERPSESGKNTFLISPRHAIGDESDSIYEYIRHAENVRNTHEQARLLYVAVTRAKKNLALLFCIPKNGKPEPRSLLASLWPALKDPESLQNGEEDSQNSQTIVTESTKKLARLTLQWQNPLQEEACDETLSMHYSTSGFFIADPAPRQTGTVIHRILQRLCEQGSGWWQDVKTDWIIRELIQAGMTEKNIETATSRIKQAVDTLLQDPKGQWIIHPHKEATSELGLTTLIDGKPCSLILDRTFVDENDIRWIIDFKTSSCEVGQETIFLEKEQAKYQKQMQNYGQAMRGWDNRPLRLGLYFPLLPAFCEYP